ncbi:hypothetical protein BH11BAC2_BH11BAC2_10320 [soil metagenome]
MALLYQVKISNIKENAQELLKSETASLEKINLTLLQFRKSKVERDEFIFDGKLYDIKSTKTIGEHIEIIAFCDEDEYHFIDKLNKLFNTKKKNKSLPEQLQKLIVSVFIIPEPCQQNYVLGESILNYLRIQEELLISYHLIFSPPPDCA